MATERELLDGSRNITRNTGDEATTKRKNDIKSPLSFRDGNRWAKNNLKQMPGNLKICIDLI